MRWVSAFGGIAVLVIAIAVMSSLDDGRIAVEASDPAPVGDPAPVVAYDPDPDRDVELGELDPSVSRLLDSSGYTEFMGTSELAVDLPQSIVDTLVSSGSVLVIPSDGGR